MSADVILVFALLALATVLFVSERVSFDIVAVLVAGTLLLSGVVTVREGLSGFSNRATITIGAMFVISEALRRTGGLDLVGSAFAHLKAFGHWITLAALMASTAFCSAFVNNTAIIAIFIPLIVKLAGDRNVSPSRLLMPVSFAAILGGTCTLVGTSTNLLVSSIAQDYELRGFSMFEFAPMGLVFVLAGAAYLLATGWRFVPARRPTGDLTTGFGMLDFLTDVTVGPSSELVDEPLDETALTADLDLDVLEIRTQDGAFSADAGPSRVTEGDVLRIRGSAAEIQKLLTRQDVTVVPRSEWYDVDLTTERAVLVEAVVAPDCSLTGESVRDADLYSRFGAVVLAIRTGADTQREDLGAVRLQGGMSLLLLVERQHISELRRSPDFLVVSETETQSYRRRRLPVALLVLAAVIGASALGLVPIVIGAVVGAVVLILTGCVTNDEAYEAIDWQVIFLLGGVLPLGVAMRKTGAADMMSDWVLGVLGHYGPRAVLSGFLLLTLVLTNLISNQASAALLAPIVIQAAGAMEVDPRPFLLAVTFGASLSFLTPVGYQTNTLIYGPGQYRFTDFTRAGLPLTVILWVVGSLLIPVFWPL